MTKGCDEARPGEATPRRVVETRPVSQTAPHLHQQFTTELPPLQAIHIADFLPRVVENAIPARYLRQQFVQSMRCRAKEIQAVAAAVEAGTSERGRGEMSEISPPSEG